MLEEVENALDDVVLAIEVLSIVVLDVLTTAAEEKVMSA